VRSRPVRGARQIARSCCSDSWLPWRLHRWSFLWRVRHATPRRIARTSDVFWGDLCVGLARFATEASSEQAPKPLVAYSLTSRKGKSHGRAMRAGADSSCFRHRASHRPIVRYQTGTKCRPPRTSAHKTPRVSRASSGRRGEIRTRGLRVMNTRAARRRPTAERPLGKSVGKSATASAPSDMVPFAPFAGVSAMGPGGLEPPTYRL
jgi:hypothetical protein